MIRDDLIAALIYAACIIAFLVAVRTTTIGQDAYDPGPRGDEPQYPFFDKHSLWHLAGSAVACLFALWIGVHWSAALLLTVAGGIAYEAVNGNLEHRGSWYDVVWDTMGALLAVGLFGGALHAQAVDTLPPPSENAHPSVIAMWVILVLAALGVILVARHFGRKASARRAETREQERYPVE